MVVRVRYPGKRRRHVAHDDVDDVRCRRRRRRRDGGHDVHDDDDARMPPRIPPVVEEAPSSSSSYAAIVGDILARPPGLKFVAHGTRCPPRSVWITLYHHRRPIRDDDYNDDDDDPPPSEYRNRLTWRAELTRRRDAATAAASGDDSPPFLPSPSSSSVVPGGRLRNLHAVELRDIHGIELGKLTMALRRVRNVERRTLPQSPHEERHPGPGMRGPSARIDDLDGDYDYDDFVFVAPCNDAVRLGGGGEGGVRNAPRARRVLLSLRPTTGRRGQ